jgi:hypothetical protein
MRKITDLLLMLPDDIASKAIINLKARHGDNTVATLTASSISSAIGSAFVWDATPEGRYFWSELSEKYANLETKELTTYGKITIKLENQENQETKN